MAALGVVAGIGAAALPLSSYADAQITVPVTAIIDDSLSIELRETDDHLGGGEALGAEGIILGNVVPGGAEVEHTIDVIVTNTKESGSVANYTLTLQDADSDTNLVAPDGVPIPAIAYGDTSGDNTEAKQYAAMVKNDSLSYWGYYVGTGTTPQGVPAYGAPAYLVGSSSAGANGPILAGKTSTTSITFLVKAGKEQTAGTYTDKVVFTASATTE